MEHHQLAVDPDEIIYAVRMSAVLTAKLPRLLTYGWQFHPGAPLPCRRSSSSKAYSSAIWFTVGY